MATKKRQTGAQRKNKRQRDAEKKIHKAKEEKRQIENAKPYRDVRWLDKAGKQCYIAIPKRMPGKAALCSGNHPDSAASTLVWTIHKSYEVASDKEMTSFANRYCASEGFKKTKLTKKEPDGPPTD